MKIITLIALLMINLSLFTNDDFNRVTQISITINGQKIESVLVEVDGRKLFTNEDGFVYVDLKPGKYEVKVVKDDHTQLFDIKVNDSTGFIQLKVED
jgi:uncharacterized membrane protein